MEKKKRMLYPIGIQNFEDLRRKGFVYVDKTAHVYDLADTGKYYFLGGRDASASRCYYRRWQHIYLCHLRS